MAEWLNGENMGSLLFVKQVAIHPMQVLPEPADLVEGQGRLP